MIPFKVYEAVPVRKPRANRDRVGDRVRWTTRAKRDYLRTFIEGHVVTVEDGLPGKYMGKLQALINAVLARRPVFGVVTGYGAREKDIDRDADAPAGRRYVRVEFELGPTCTFSAYFEEKDLVPAGGKRGLA